MRFYELEQESVITIDDVSIKEMNIEWLRNSVSLLKVSKNWKQNEGRQFRIQIGIVQQEPIVFAMTVEENLRMGKPDATTTEMIQACKMANAHEFIVKLTYVEFYALYRKLLL